MVPPKDAEAQSTAKYSYHVCESSTPPWITLRNATGTVSLTSQDSLIEVDIDASKMVFDQRSNAQGYMPACAMLVVTLEPKRSSEEQTRNGQTAATASRQLVVPVLCTLKQ